VSDISDEAAIDAAVGTVSRRVHERAFAAVELLEMLIHAQGRVVRRDQELWAGHTVLNYDRELLPRVSRASSVGLSIYLGNRRIATYTSLDAGPAPEVGAYADAELVDSVLRRRQTYRGMLDVGGRPTMVAARPLFASDKPEEYGPIGILEAFQDMATLREFLSNSLRPASADESDSPRAPMYGERLSTMTDFLDDVARRLQLLALNGNIIAAQAGDHGRAFRVVCRELGSLADQSKDVVSETRRASDLRVPTPEAIPDHDGDGPPV
jgi:hypothetical protein